jgi:hypothetical protein
MERYLEALGGLPERRLTIIDMAWKFTKPNGQLDQELMSFHIQEIQEARREANAYAIDTKEAIAQLCRLQRSQS